MAIGKLVGEHDYLKKKKKSHKSLEFMYWMLSLEELV